jgi:hypothetical protein
MVARQLHDAEPDAAISIRLVASYPKLSQLYQVEKEQWSP